MTSVLTVDGKEYIPAADAAKDFGYTKDYLLVLAKGKKIDGKKIGNRWYIEPSSTEEFFKQAKLKREEWKRQVSEERKIELREYVGDVHKAHHRTALVETLVIIIIGLSLGAVGYLGVSPQTAQVQRGDYGFFENIARSLYALIAPLDTTTETRVSSSESNAHVAQLSTSGSEVATSAGTTTYTSIVVAPDEVMTAETIEAIQDSFSDEVEVSVDPDKPQTGIIIPIFKDHDGDTYRFVMVPVKTATTPP